MHPRQVAKASGAKRYVGKPCPHGHSGERLTVSGWCVTCHRSNVKAYAPKGPRSRDPIKMAAWRRAYYDRNTEVTKQRAAAWIKQNPWMRAVNDAARKAAELQRTPKWVDEEGIARIYKNCPAGYHVDHVVPLRGKLVSGLHVGDNLQYLPAIENIKKGNRYVVA